MYRKTFHWVQLRLKTWEFLGKARQLIYPWTLSEGISHINIAPEKHMSFFDSELRGGLFGVCAC